jgi:hypothetical protein
LCLLSLFFFVKFYPSIHVYTNVKETATTGFIALSMENPVIELEDFDRLVERYRTRVFRFVFVSVRDWDLAETLTQDCFWKAYKHRDAFRGDCSAMTWLMRIAVNLVRDEAVGSSSGKKPRPFRTKISAIGRIEAFLRRSGPL